MGDPWQAIVSHLPPDLQRTYSTAELDIPDAATAALYAKSYAKLVQFVGMLYQAGVVVVAGTDELAGFTLQGELELLVKAGLTPAQALQVATLTAAQVSQVDGQKGQYHASVKTPICCCWKQILPKISAISASWPWSSRRAKRFIQRISTKPLVSNLLSALNLPLSKRQ